MSSQLVNADYPLDIVRIEDQIATLYGNRVPIPMMKPTSLVYIVVSVSYVDNYMV